MKPKRVVYRGLSPEDRFWKRVDRSGGSASCWLWTGCLLDPHKMGYGQFTIMGKGIASHRYSWTIFNGPIPNGLLVLHKCDNPVCVNPKHLFLGTRADNRSDCVRKGRQCRPKGEDNHEAKLTSSQVLEIRRLEGLQPRKLTAVQFGISNNHVGAIVRREKWGHL